MLCFLSPLLRYLPAAVAIPWGLRMTGEERLLDLLAGGATLRWRDLPRLGIPTSALQRLRDADKVEPCGKGYRLKEAPALKWEKAAELAASHPGGVLCLETALRLHGALAGTGPLADITDELTTIDTVALPRGSWQGARSHGARIVAWSDARLFDVGVETYDIGGVLVRATTPARTIADMLRPLPNPEAQTWTDGTPLVALRALAAAGGPDAVGEVGKVAAKLGWGRDIMQLVNAVKEVATWRPQP